MTSGFHAHWDGFLLTGMQRRRRKCISQTNTLTRACTRRAGFSTRSVSLWGFWRDAVAAKASSGGRHPWLLCGVRICLPRLIRLPTQQTTKAASRKAVKKEKEKMLYITCVLCSHRTSLAVRVRATRETVVHQPKIPVTVDTEQRDGDYPAFPLMNAGQSRSLG
jgi:hypothetical protein